MDDLISRQAAIEHIEAEYQAWGDEYDVRQILGDLEDLPSAQPERKRGKWEITEAYPHNVYCSECHHKFAQTHWAVWEDGTLPRNYCPNCGSYNGGGDNEQID